MSLLGYYMALSSLKAQVTSNLIGEYLFSNNTNDTSGYGKNATLLASSTYIADRFGNPLSALNNRAYVNDSSAFSFCDANGDLPFTIDFYVYLTNKGDQVFLAKRENWYGTVCEWQIGIFEGVLVFTLFNNGGSSIYGGLRSSISLINTNQWVNIKGTYNGEGYDGLNLYINGTQTTNNVFSVGGTYTKMVTTQSKLTFGTFSEFWTTHPIQGYIDDVKIYNNVI